MTGVASLLGLNGGLQEISSLKQHYTALKSAEQRFRSSKEAVTDLAATPDREHSIGTSTCIPSRVLPKRCHPRIHTNLNRRWMLASPNRLFALRWVADEEVLVPLTGSLFVPGTIKSASRVLVDVGTGFYVEKSPADAADILGKKVSPYHACRFCCNTSSWVPPARCPKESPAASNGSATALSGLIVHLGVWS
jgi:prefoldin subunit 5